MKAILERRANIIDTAEQGVLDRIVHIKRKTRENAIHTLTHSLNPELESDQVIFQTLPLELIERGELIGAIWYLETVGKLGNALNIEIIEQVFKEAIGERENLLLIEDVESIEVLDSSVCSLFRMLLKHSDYSNHPRIFLMMGYYEEILGDSHLAIKQYDKGIELGDIESYLSSARVYENLALIEMSLFILEAGFNLYADTRFLGQIIRLLCKLGRKREAYTRYSELKLVGGGGMVPFIVYKGNVETDNELSEVEEIIASYITEGSLMPSEALHALSVSSSYYIAEEMHKENNILNKLHEKENDKWEESDYEQYSISIFRRLRLMQIDILTFGNHRYLELYLRDIVRLGLEGSDTMRGNLQNFFYQSFSAEVHHASEKREKLYSKNTKEIISDAEDEVSSRGGIEATISVFENLSLHVSRIGELYFSPSFFDIQRDTIVPILRESAILEGDYDSDMEDEMIDALHALGDETHYYYALKPSIRENYENFIDRFDKKYGVFYRRHVQAIAMDVSIMTEKYPKALNEYTDVALLFWIEKMMSGQFPTDNPEEIEKIVQTYSLDNTDILDALLFGSMMFDVSIDYSIAFLADFPNMLDVPEAIYIITEGLRSMDSRERKLAIKDLHKLTQERYDARGFFEHIRFTFSDIMRNNPSDEDTSEMLLASGNVAILQKKEQVQSILNFVTAGEQFDSLEGLLQAGDSYQDIGEFEKAFELFERAFVKDGTINVLTRLLNCSICSGKYEQAEKYIQYGIMKGYSIDNYILAFYLWQGKTEPAFLMMVEMIKNKKNVINMPEGLPKLLFDTLNFILQLTNSFDADNNRLRVLASFIYCNVIPNNDPVVPENYKYHWTVCKDLIDSCVGEIMHEKIRETLSLFTGEIEDVEMQSKSLPEQSAEYIDTHATNIIMTLEKLLEDEESNDMRKRIIMSMNDIRALTIELLRKFPNTDTLIAGWRNELSFSGVKDAMIVELVDSYRQGYAH